MVAAGELAVFSTMDDERTPESYDCMGAISTSVGPHVSHNDDSFAGHLIAQLAVGASIGERSVWDTNSMLGIRVLANPHANEDELAASVLLLRKEALSTALGLKRGFPENITRVEGILHKPSGVSSC